MKKKFGLNDQQIAQYKVILNKRQVDLQKLKTANLTPDERRARMAEINSQADQSLQQIVSPQQFGKISHNRDRFKMEQSVRKAKSGANNHQTQQPPQAQN